MPGSALLVSYLVAVTLFDLSTRVAAVKLTAKEALGLRSRKHIDGGDAHHVIETLQFRHRLRACNAYPYPAAIDVHRGDEDLTGGTPLKYKECRDFLAHLHDGDRIIFSVGGTGAGTFLVNRLPNNDAILLLVIKRHDTLSTAVAFDSHVFAHTLNAQVVVIDTYQGQAVSTLSIMDSDSGGSGNSRSEDLRYNTVVAVNSGIYHMVLESDQGATKARSDLVVLNRECYVVLRTGIEAQQGPSYEQELIVFPRSSVLALMGGSAALATRCIFALSLALVHMLVVGLL